MIGMIRWVFIGTLVVLGCALLYLSALTMKTKIAWAKKIKFHEERVTQLEAELKTLQLGTEPNRTRVYSPYDAELNPVAIDKAPEIGLRLVTDASAWWVRQRGRRWAGTTTKLDNATGAATISIDEPRPHDISATVADKEVISYQFLYAFDGREGGTAGYLGEFRVVGVTKNDTTNTIDVAPNDTLSPQELDKLVKNSGAGVTWHLFERLPTDHYATFANAEEAINTYLPASVRKEYADHGRDAIETDPKENRITIDGVEKYQRPLYDFMKIYRDLRAARPILNDKVLARTNDRDALQTALKQLIDPLPPAEPTSGRIVDRNKEIAKLEKDLADAKLDADRVVTELMKLETEVTQARAVVTELLAKNKELAAQIVKSQLQAQTQSPTVTAGAK